MVYRFCFTDKDNKEYVLLGRKYLQKDERGGIPGIREILVDYTTLYCHLNKVAQRERARGGAAEIQDIRNTESRRQLAGLPTLLPCNGNKQPCP